MHSSIVDAVIELLHKRAKTPICPKEKRQLIVYRTIGITWQ